MQISTEPRSECETFAATLLYSTGPQNSCREHRHVFNIESFGYGESSFAETCFRTNEARIFERSLRLAQFAIGAMPQPGLWVLPYGKPVAVIGQLVTLKSFKPSQGANPGTRYAPWVNVMPPPSARGQVSWRTGCNLVNVSRMVIRNGKPTSTYILCSANSCDDLTHTPISNAMSKPRWWTTPLWCMLGNESIKPEASMAKKTSSSC